MASNSYPRPGHNGGSLTNHEHELLHHWSPDGVYGNPQDTPPIIADTTIGRAVKLRAHLNAHVRGSFYWAGTTDIPIPLAANTSGQPRIDRIVLRLDRTTYEVKEHPLTGTPAANPVPPALRQDGGNTGMWDFPMADVRVEHNASIITADKLTRRCWYIGDDGEIACDENSYPPHQRGRAVWVHGSSPRWVVSNGTKWLPAVDDSGVATLTINSSLFVGSHYYCYKRNGWAWAELTASRPGGQLNANTAYKVATLPVGFRPPVLFQFAFTVPSTSGVGVGAVHTDGAIYVNPGAYSIPAGRSFVCALGSWPAVS